MYIQLYVYIIHHQGFVQRVWDQSSIPNLSVVWNIQQMLKWMLKLRHDKHQSTHSPETHQRLLLMCVSHIFSTVSIYLLNNLMSSVREQTNQMDLVNSWVLSHPTPNLFFFARRDRHRHSAVGQVRFRRKQTCFGQWRLIPSILIQYILGLGQS